MRNTITEALIYENQGLRDDAIEIYKNILKSDPNNKDAQNGVRRLSGLKTQISANKIMLEFFLNLKNDDEIREFKRWLVGI